MTIRTFLKFLTNARHLGLTGPLFAALLGLVSVSHANSEQLLEMRESKYSNIYIYQKGDYLSMRFGHNRRLYTESVYNPQNDRELPVIYTRYMTVGLAYAKSLDAILQIGLGGGRTSWYIHKHLPDSSVTAAEIDPEVISLAKKYFGIKEEKHFRIVSRDGRLFLANHKGQFDVIFIDAYRGAFVPFHLLTTEFYRLVKEKLKPGGVVVQNIEPGTMLFDAALVTIRSVFQNIDLFDAGGNMVAVAYEGSPRATPELVQNAIDLQNKFHFFHDVSILAAERRFLSTMPKGEVLTDDFAPVEYLNAIEKHNRKR